MKTKRKRILASIAAVATAACLFAVVPSHASTSMTQFTDVPAGAWYFDNLEYGVANGYISGTSATTISPNATMTRGQFVSVLGRIVGVDAKKVELDGRFSDVEDTDYFAPYVYWAADAGIVSGTGSGRFNPNANITREAMAVIVANYLDSVGKKLPDAAAISAFADAGRISSWAKDAVETLRRNGILTGDEKGNVNPQKNMTRAEGMTVLVKLAKQLGLGDEQPVPCTGISVTPSSLELKVGEKAKLQVTLQPSNVTSENVGYSSSNTAVAVVSKDGEVTATGAGSAVITATSGNGQKATMTVTVSKLPQNPLNESNWLQLRSDTVYLTYNEVKPLSEILTEESYDYFVNTFLPRMRGSDHEMWTLQVRVANSGFHTEKKDDVYTYGFKGEELGTATGYIYLLVEEYPKGAPEYATTLYEREIPLTIVVTEANGETGQAEKPNVETSTSPLATTPAKDFAGDGRSSFGDWRDGANSRAFSIAVTEEFEKLLNAERESLGLTPLAINNEWLMDGALIRAEEMETFWGHGRPNGTTFTSVYEDLCDYYVHLENGENGYKSGIASTWSAQWISAQELAENAFNAWKESPGHYRILVLPLREGQSDYCFCCGVYVGDDGWLYMVFESALYDQNLTRN